MRVVKVIQKVKSCDDLALDKDDDRVAEDLVKFDSLKDQWRVEVVVEESACHQNKCAEENQDWDQTKENFTRSFMVTKPTSVMKIRRVQCQHVVPSNQNTRKR